MKKGQGNPGREIHLDRAHEWARLQGQSKALGDETIAGRQGDNRIRETADATISVADGRKVVERGHHGAREDKEAVGETYGRSLRFTKFKAERNPSFE